MSSVPARDRGAASGMRATFQNSGMSLSIGIFFSLMIAGLAAALPRTLTAGLHAQGVPAAIAAQVSHLPPVSTVFAALLGYNPVQHLLAASGVLATLPRHNVAVLTGKQFFPHLIAGPFHHGLIIVFSAAAAMSVVGALVSLLRGRQFYYDAPEGAGPPGVPRTAVPPHPIRRLTDRAPAPRPTAVPRRPVGRRAHRRRAPRPSGVPNADPGPGGRPAAGPGRTPGISFQPCHVMSTAAGPAARPSSATGRWRRRPRPAPARGARRHREAALHGVRRRPGRAGRRRPGSAAGGGCCGGACGCG